MKTLQGKKAIITGASSGFGEAAAQLFARQGCDLLLIARREERLHQLKDKLKSTEVQVDILVEDVRDHSSINEKLQDRLAQFTPDILINNAGLVKGLAKVWETPEDDWETMFDTNVNSILNLTKQIIPGMLQRRSGLIINVGSISGHQTYPGGGIYCATKFALRAITDTLRMELAGTGVRASYISPGMAETEFSQVRFNGDTEKAKEVYQGIEALKAEDIAEALLFIASRPPHVNIADLVLFPSQQASTTLVKRN